MALLLLLTLLGTCHALFLPTYPAQQTLLQEWFRDTGGHVVPGDSPVQYCHEQDVKKDIFEVDSVDFHPNPPKRGSHLTIDIQGTFKEDTGKTPRFTLNATYGSVHSIDTVEDLCDHVDVVQNQTLTCPPKKGKALLTTTISINELMIPPGNYTQKVDAYTEEGAAIFCFFAAVTLT